MAIAAELADTGPARPAARLAGPRPTVRVARAPAPLRSTRVATPEADTARLARNAGVLLGTLTAIALLFGVHAVRSPRAPAAAPVAVAADRGGLVQVEGRVRTVSRDGVVELDWGRGATARVRLVDVTAAQLAPGDEVEVEGILRDVRSDGGREITGLAVTKR